MKKYAAANPDAVVGKMIVLEENMSDIPNFVQTSKKAGLRSLIVDYDQDVLPIPKIIEAVRRFREECEESGIRCMSTHRTEPLLKCCE